MTIKYDGDGGDPAFPFPDQGFKGMSLRDYFAGQAIAGAALTIAGRTDFTSRKYAYSAYQVADIMLSQRDVAALIAKEGDDE